MGVVFVFGKKFQSIYRAGFKGGRPGLELRGLLKKGADTIEITKTK